VSVLGIAEVTLQTGDLDRLKRFYVEVIGLPVLQDQDDRVWLSAGKDSRIGLWTPGTKEFGDQPGVHVHFALTVEAPTLNALVQRLRAAETDFRGPVEHEGGDRSLYWTDPDGHCGEAWELFAGDGTTEDVQDSLNS
jgi:catechol-2,3-dioxygenase